MNIYLLLSVLCSTGLFIILRSFVSWKVDSLHGITFNYFTAAIISYCMIDGNLNTGTQSSTSFIFPCLITGVLFIIVFFITAKTSQFSGIAVASIASKMSMVIPVTAGIILYNESVSAQKIIGILIAIPAVLLSGNQVSDNASIKIDRKYLILPVALFIGAGIVDTAIKFIQHNFMNDDNRQVVIMLIFASAGVTGMLRLIYELVYLKKTLVLRSVFAGILLGTVNYLSLYFLLKCLEDPASESSTVFAIVNIGVIITSFVAGLVLFKEKAGNKKIAGIILALVAIVVLSIQF